MKKPKRDMNSLISSFNFDYVKKSFSHFSIISVAGFSELKMYIFEFHSLIKC